MTDVDAAVTLEILEAWDRVERRTVPRGVVREGTAFIEALAIQRASVLQARLNTERADHGKASIVG